MFDAEYPYFSDRGDRTYSNPVRFADYSDPDVIRVGAEYFMVASTFNFVPGLPVLRSTDLVNWTIIATPSRESPATGTMRSTRGAPFGLPRSAVGTACS